VCDRKSGLKAYGLSVVFNRAVRPVQAHQGIAKVGIDLGRGGSEFEGLLIVFNGLLNPAGVTE
jgi:hypothetical protein